jgi:DNA uptake protein ComE-like DNA-binding protein
MSDENKEAINDAKKLLISNGLNVLTDEQLGGIRHKGKESAMKESESKLSELRDINSTLKMELEELKTTGMSEVELKDLELKKANDKLSDLATKMSSLENEYKQAQAQTLAEKRDRLLIDLFGAKSEDIGLTVRECLYQFPNLSLNDNALVYQKPSDGTVSTNEETLEKLNTWFNERTLLHKRNPNGPKLKGKGTQSIPQKPGPVNISNIRREVNSMGDLGSPIQITNNEE